MIFVAQSGSLTMSDRAGDVCGTQRPELVSSGLGLLSCTLGQIRGGGVSYRMGISGRLRKFLCTRLSLLLCLDHPTSQLATWCHLNIFESHRITCLSREKTPGDSPIMEYHGSPLFLRVTKCICSADPHRKIRKGVDASGLAATGVLRGCSNFSMGPGGGQGGQTKQGKRWMLAQLVIGDIPAAKI